VSDSPTPVESASAESSLIELVGIMARLRAECGWKAAQTHRTLAKHLLEETYETIEAIEALDSGGSPDHLREELGDVLLQVLFHARIAAESPVDRGGFDIDDIAGDLTAKLIRRHPHVFAVDGADPADVERDTVRDAADQQIRWDELKKAEHGRVGALAGVALAAPATALSGKLGARSAKFGLDVPLPTGDSPAEQIFRLAFELGATGADPETAVRAVAR
jgi:XTP/dITP diphosphohydrolase